MSIEKSYSALTQTGLVCAVREVPFLTDEPKIPACVTSLSTLATERYGDLRRFGYGYGRDRMLAAVKAQAECLERLCLACVPEERLSRGVYSAVGGVDPTLFLNHDGAGSGDAARQPYRWFAATDRVLGRQCKVPAQMIFLRAFEDEFPLRRQHISTGGALGEAGSGQAFQGGLFETIERDASISSYLKRRPLKRVADLPEEAKQVAEYLERYALEVYPLDATTDLGVPTVLAVTLDRSGLGPAINIGCKTAPTYAEALTGAMFESIQARRSQRLSDPSTHGKRVRYWSPAERIAELGFWLDAPEETSWEELKRINVTADEAVRRLTERGYHVFEADITLPEVREQGFEAVRVVVPELHALYLDESCKVLYSPHHGVIEDDPSLPPHPIG